MKQVLNISQTIMRRCLRLNISTRWKPDIEWPSSIRFQKKLSLLSGIGVAAFNC